MVFAIFAVFVELIVRVALEHPAVVSERGHGHRLINEAEGTLATKAMIVLKKDGLAALLAAK